ncbi:MAG TPA: hypothetical protein VK978_05060 [Candidatus Saccharimonadales bacterium]|nr:hypothetical protein [Candidatus Saccharimonadales bacterium]
MNTKRVSYLMIGLLSLLVLGILGSAYLANGLFEKQAATLNELKLKSEILAAEQQSLIKAKKDVATYKPLADIARVIVPQDKDQAQAVREIVKLARESGIQPSSITFPTSNLGAVTPGAAATGTVAAPSTGKNNLSQLTPVKGATGLYVLPIVITQDAATAVPYDRFITFLGKLEQNRRTAQVSDIVLQPSTKDRNLLSFTLTVDQYIKP